MLIARVRARIVPVVASVLIGCTGIGSMTAESGATVDPCKLLTQEEIAKVFGSSVSDGKKGLTTAERSQCEYSVAESSEEESSEEQESQRPDGALIVTIVSAGAKTAYDDSKSSITFAPIAELPNGLYNQTQSLVDVLAGNVLLRVQGIFLPVELVPVPAHMRDVRSELVELAKLAVKRI